MIAVTGHRGARDLFPENTLRGFGYANEIGCDRVELDVWLTRDLRLAVIHDCDLSRTTNGSGAVADHTLREIQALDAGNGERVPSLENVFEMLRESNITIQVELKGPGTEVQVAKIVTAWQFEQRIVCTSFFHRRVKSLTALVPTVQTGILVSCNPADPVGLMASANADALHVHYQRIDPCLVDTVHAAGKPVVAWGRIVEESDIDDLIAMNVDVIGSDRPDIVLERLRITEKGTP